MTHLAERLGYGPDAKLLIVNCDDLGSSRSANAAIADVLAKGTATSATLMVPCPWALAAAKSAPAGRIGVHLTLTCEYPGYRWRSLTGSASLHDDEGFMPSTIAAVWAKADLADVRAECRAQVDQALAWGVDVTHLDAHMGTLQLDPRYFSIYLEMAEAYDLPLRMVSPKGEEMVGFACRAPAAARGLVFPDHMTTTWGKPARPAFEAILQRLKPGVTELYVHPVEDGPELRAYDPKEAQIRVDDHALLAADDIAGLVAAARATPISFAPLRDLQRSA